mmetsp:Transcript_115408/g.337473  ORF Transcript_115408/g.337473 Transcript_115408/m.337473 type:complete len:477 (-) Transcript_115408:1225-2655(-)
MVIGMAEPNEDLDLELRLPGGESFEDLWSHGQVAHGFQPGTLHKLVLYEEQVPASSPGVCLDRAEPQLFTDRQQVGQCHGSLELEQLVAVLQHLHQRPHGVQLLAVLQQRGVRDDQDLGECLASGVAAGLLLQVHEAQQRPHPTAAGHEAAMVLLGAEVVQREGGHLAGARGAACGAAGQTQHGARARRPSPLGRRPLGLALAVLQHAPGTELRGQLLAAGVHLPVLHRPCLRWHPLVELLDRIEVVLLELVEGELVLLGPDLVLAGAAEVVDDRRVEDCELGVFRELLWFHEVLHCFECLLGCQEGLLEFTVNCEACAALVEPKAEPPSLIQPWGTMTACTCRRHAFPRLVQRVSQFQEEVKSVKDLLPHLLVVPCDDCQHCDNLGAHQALAALLSISKRIQEGVDATAVDELLARLLVTRGKQHALSRMVLGISARRFRGGLLERPHNGQKGSRRLPQQLRSCLQVDGKQRGEA